MDEQQHIEFENTSNKTEYTRGYSITGAPAMPSQVDPTKTFLPTSARFIIQDGEATGLFLTVHQIMKNGNLSKSGQMMPGIFIWNQNEWPDWLNTLYLQVMTDYRTERNKEAEKIVHSHNWRRFVRVC